MLRIRELQEALMHVVGWAQDLNPDNQIDKDLCQSESGLTFQGAHPLLTLENVRSIMPDNYLFNYPAWNQLITYRVGDKVRHNDIIWIANGESVDVEPQKSDFNQDFNKDFGSEAAGAWVVYNMESDFIRQKTIEGITTAVQNFIQQKQLNKETKSLMERRTLFDGAARLKATITNRHKLVGFEIVPVRSMGVTTKIEKIGLQMVGAVGEIKLYIFHSSQYAPKQVVTLNFTNTNGGFQWFTPSTPIYLPYIADGNDSGGAWFICYSQDDLPFGMEALNVSKDWSKEPCQTCLGGSIESWHEITKYMQVSPFTTEIPDDFSNDPRMFDIGDLGYTNTMNYGLNLEVSVACDLTDFIISQRDMFATIIQKQVAASMLRTMAMNPDVRINRNQVNLTRDELLYEIDGAPQSRPTGLAYELAQAYKALDFDTKGLDRICLKCNNHGVRYGVVG